MVVVRYKRPHPRRGTQTAASATRTTGAGTSWRDENPWKMQHCIKKYTTLLLALLLLWWLFLYGPEEDYLACYSHYHRHVSFYQEEPLLSRRRK
jgi:hypothetical protein